MTNAKEFIQAAREAAHGHGPGALTNVTLPKALDALEAALAALEELATGDKPTLEVIMETTSAIEEMLK